MEKKKIMVMGASGVLGQLICRELLRVFNNQIQLIVTDYKKERGELLANSMNTEVQFQQLDVNNPENIKLVVNNIDIVVVVVTQLNPFIQEVCIQNKIACIDVSPFYDFAEKVHKFHHNAVNNETVSIVMSGFFPGLSGLLVKKAIRNFEEVEEVNVGLLQSTNARVGGTGILDMLKIITQPVKDGNHTIPGFTKRRNMKFHSIVQEKEVRRIHHSEIFAIESRQPVKSIQYWTAWDDYMFTKLIACLRRLGFIRLVQKLDNHTISKMIKHDPNKSEMACMTVEVSGIKENRYKTNRVSLSTFSDYHTTAMLTASLAKIMQRKKWKGVVFPFEIVDLDEVLNEINCQDIKWGEFEM
ncbi:saccharopine dehydrogenase-like NADP-dependent oxidoreductase [Sporosarcina luteola]|nr:saccharopine dehydrogenase-like NADP-dependent oxidoreductase [Sporosarcina luteola]